MIGDNWLVLCRCSQTPGVPAGLAPQTYRRHSDLGCLVVQKPLCQDLHMCRGPRSLHHSIRASAPSGTGSLQPVTCVAFAVSYPVQVHLKVKQQQLSWECWGLLKVLLPPASLSGPSQTDLHDSGSLGGSTPSPAPTDPKPLGCGPCHSS